MDAEEFSRLHQMEESWLAHEREQGQNDPDLWRWSPTHLGVFNQMLRAAIEQLPAGNATFFEAGCGIGTKLALAKAYGLRELGWEVFDEYISFAKALGVNVEKHDLRAETPSWDKFDIVYIARPFKDDAYERDWEASVQRAMRPGAVLMASFAGVKPYTWPCFYREPWRGVWRKPVNLAIGARELSRDQLRYGTD